MNPNSESQIQIIVRRDQDESRSDRVRLVSRVVDISELREQYRKFMSSLKSIIDVEGGDAGPFQLNEIQFNAEITGNGEFKLLGTGVGVEAKSAVTFVLQRDRAEQQTTVEQS